ncbi:MAG: hypothetical protein JRM78_02300 [Nitrososphaerota archaeon]|nr:hypothetical protein [Nitrososphaerota archaeon]
MTEFRSRGKGRERKVYPVSGQSTKAPNEVYAQVQGYVFNFDKQFVDEALQRAHIPFRTAGKRIVRTDMVIYFVPRSKIAEASRVIEQAENAPEL